MEISPYAHGIAAGRTGYSDVAPLDKREAGVGFGDAQYHQKG